MALSAQIEQSVQALERAGVVHGDLRDANMLWNEEVKGVMIVHFERSKIREGALTKGIVKGVPKRDWC